MAGPGDLGNLLKQAQKMQREMDLAREEISGMTLEGSAGGSGGLIFENAPSDEVMNDDKAAKLWDLSIKAVGL